jgi:protein transport protein SEC23
MINFLKGGRVMLFTGGPVTEGPGQIAAEELREPLRSHTDIQKENAKYTKKAFKFFSDLAKRASTNGHVIDVFACALDQIGFHEMQDLVKKTGGLVVLADFFDDSMFKQSFQKIFTRDAQGNLPMAFNANIEVQCSRELKVSGAIGHCFSAAKASSSVGETVLIFSNYDIFEIFISKSSFSHFYLGNWSWKHLCLESRWIR